MRLQKYMASAGVGSRRACEKLIEDGKVTINGKVASIGNSVSDEDIIEYDGKVINLNNEYEYYLLFKPVGVITTAKDDRGRQTVVDIVKSKSRVYPVGRLDVNTSGLLLLTNDGEMANRLMHPRYKIEKTYKAVVYGKIDEDKLNMLRNGVMLEDGMTSPAKAKVVKEENGKSMVEITISEGRNRQVRRMFDAVGSKVINLRRTRMGGLTLKDIEKGEYRELSSKEIEYLKQICNL